MLEERENLPLKEGIAPGDDGQSPQTILKREATELEEESRGSLVQVAFAHPPRSAIDRASLTKWCAEHGWETVLNRAGTTFRKLDEAQKADLDQDKAIELMLAQPSMIKRPVLDLGERTLVGFKPDLYAAALA